MCKMKYEYKYISVCTVSTFFRGFGFCTIEDNSASERYIACIKLYQKRNQITIIGCTDVSQTQNMRLFG